MSEALIQAIAKQVALARGAHCWEDTPSTERRTCRAYAANALHEADKAPSPVQRVEELERHIVNLEVAAELIGADDDCTPAIAKDIAEAAKAFGTLLDSKEGK